MRSTYILTLCEEKMHNVRTSGGDKWSPASPVLITPLSKEQFDLLGLTLSMVSLQLANGGHRWLCLSSVSKQYYCWPHCSNWIEANNNNTGQNMSLFNHLVYDGNGSPVNPPCPRWPLLWKKYDYPRTVRLQTRVSCIDVKVWIMIVMIALWAILS